MYFTQADIEQLFIEDLPLHNETTRQHGVLSGMAPLVRMAQSLNLRAA
ncbi:MAG: hypothetical protein WCA24_09155 [Thiomonas sp.]